MKRNQSGAEFATQVAGVHKQRGVSPPRAHALRLWKWGTLLLAVASAPAEAAAEGSAHASTRLSSEPITFSVTGDAPYGAAEIPAFQEQLDAHNLYSPSDFLVHVGDIKSGSEPCVEDHYETVAAMLQGLAVPAFIVPGDNEWTDCLDPDQAWQFWETHLLGLESNFCGTPSVERQPGRSENLAFIQKGVLFIGINLVGGTNDSNILQDDADWVSQQLQAHVGQVRAAVVFAQAGPGDNRTLFFEQFESAAATFAKPILYIHGDGHSWIEDAPFQAANVKRVQIDRGDQPPVHVTVQLSGGVNIFQLERNPWPNGTPLLNRPPCADAGPDRSIALSQHANLSGMASDDGVPNNPVDFEVQWSQIAGPAGVSIVDPASPVTSASFSTTGTYALQLTADDGAVSTRDTMSVVVGDGPSTNQAPVASSDGYEIQKEQVLTASAPGVLANDNDADGDLITAILVDDVSSGVLTLNSNGSFTYTPDAGFVGVDAFSYSAFDGSLQSNAATVSIDVTPYSVSFAPTNDATILSTAPDSSIGTDNDLRVEQDSNVYRSYLKFSVTGLGSVVYAARLRLYVNNGSDDVGAIHAVSNYYEGTGTAWVETVLTWNNAPAIVTPALDALASAASGTWVEFDLTDAITGDGIYSFAIQNASDNSVEFDAKEGGNTPQLIVETEEDGGGGNASPVAVADTWATLEETPLAVPAPGVLGNDSDANGDSLVASIASGPAGGALLLNADGSFTYTPSLDFAGADTFDYLVSDDRGATDVGRVTIQVTGINDPPVAVADAYATLEDEALIVGGAGVVANDIDVDGDALSATLLVAPGHGTLVLNVEGSFTYTPHPDFNGSDTFSYRAEDGSGESSSASVGLMVSAVNDDPVAVDDSATTTVSTPLTVAAPGVLGNDTDPEADPLTAVLRNGPAKKWVTLAPDGGFTYAPTPGFVGVQSFGYSVRDGNGGSHTGTLTITVTEANAAPVATADAYAMAEDDTLLVVAPGVLANDSDVDGDSLSVTLETAAAHGVVSLNPEGAFTYTPEPQFNGTDTFTYTLEDGRGGTDVGSVALSVSPSNDAPIATAESFHVRSGSKLRLAAPGVLLNDSDADGDSLVAQAETMTQHGLLRLEADGGLTYSPAPGFSGSDSFSYRATDGVAESAAITVTLHVRARAVTHQESHAAGSSSTTSVATTASLLPVQGELYVAAVSTHPDARVDSVAGMGLTWSPLRAQCSARGVSGVDVWVGQGVPSAGSVQVAFDRLVDNATLLVSRFAGVDPAIPVGASVSGNSNGVNGNCSGGTDSATYQFELNTSEAGGLLVAAVAPRDREHLAAAGWGELSTAAQGDSSRRAALALVGRATAPGEESVEGRFDAPADWAVVAFEIRPAVESRVVQRSPRRSAELAEPTPSPFNGWTTVRYTLYASTHVVADVYNVRGQRVRRLLDERQTAGRRRLDWDARNQVGAHVESGVYFIRVRLGEATHVRKVILVK
ncbi:MAG: tandem-95 repeat protein [Candidatus Latescibacterota bacterium]|nr:MAG: tandem-95 repeat protein [Candidatus Latescibacterota bacterium]